MSFYVPFLICKPGTVSCFRSGFDSLCAIIGLFIEFGVSVNPALTG